jgi:hypothetical protein
MKREILISGLVTSNPVSDGLITVAAALSYMNQQNDAQSGG